RVRAFGRFEPPGELLVGDPDPLAIFLGALKQDAPAVVVLDLVSRGEVPVAPLGLWRGVVGRDRRQLGQVRRRLLRGSGPCQGKRGGRAPREMAMPHRVGSSPAGGLAPVYGRSAGGERIPAHRGWDKSEGNGL